MNRGKIVIGALVFLVAMQPTAVLANDIAREPLRGGVMMRGPLVADDDVIVLTGALAMKEMKDVARARGAEWEAVEQQLAELGASPTNEVAVLTTKPGAPGPAVRVIFWSWNDGNMSEWKGVVFAEKHARDRVGAEAAASRSMVSAVVMTREAGKARMSPLGPEAAYSQFIDFIGCAFDLCMADLEMCAWLGPLIGPCFAVMCAASIIACAKVHL